MKYQHNSSGFPELLLSFITVFLLINPTPLGINRLACWIWSVTRHQINEDALRDLEIFTLIDDVEHCFSGGISTVGVAECAEEAVAIHVSVHIVDNQCACGVAADVGVGEEAAELIDRVAVSVRVDDRPGDTGVLSQVMPEYCLAFATNAAVSPMKWYSSEGFFVILIPPLSAKAEALRLRTIAKITRIVSAFFILVFLLNFIIFCFLFFLIAS